MADTLATTLIASIEWLRKETLDLSTVYDRAKLELNEELADGTAADQADILWHDQRTLGTGANDDLDLTALTQTVFGSTVTINFAKVSAILIVNTDTIAGRKLQIDSSVANAFTGWCNASITSKAEIGPDSALFLSSKKDAWAVTAGTGDILRINNPSAGSIVYNIAIVGRSA